jgi:hypothetical protein
LIEFKKYALTSRFLTASKHIVPPAPHSIELRNFAVKSLFPAESVIPPYIVFVSEMQFDELILFALRLFAAPK